MRDGRNRRIVARLISARDGLPALALGVESALKTTREGPPELPPIVSAVVFDDPGGGGGRGPGWPEERARLGLTQFYLLARM